jgi:cytochrome c-type biogenesis protein CcmH
MNAFLAGALGLVVITLALLMPPLLRRKAPPVRQARRAALNLALLREQMQEIDVAHKAGAIDDAAHAQARQELQQRVAEEVLPQAAPLVVGQSRWPGIAVGFAIPVIAAALYIAIGAPAALLPAEAANHSDSAQEVEAMVAGLARRLETQPDNADGWHMLARSYNVLGRYQQASEAYARLVKLTPDDARLYADYADTLAMAQGQSLAGEPERLIEQALRIDPTSLKALALSGSAAFERGDFQRAVAEWEKLMALAPEDSDVMRTTSDSLAQAKRLLAGQQKESTGSLDIAPIPRASPAVR